MESPVKNIIQTHYWRIFQVLENLELTCLLDTSLNKIIKNQSPDVALKCFYKNVKSILTQTPLVDKTQAEILRDLLGVEHGKINFRTSESRQLLTIEKMEKKFNRDRDKLMELSLKDYRGLTFKINPFVRTNVSGWEWVLRERDYETYDLKSNFNKPKSANYFLFQQIWFYDELSCSNVFEYPLNKYQYFFMDFLSQNSNIGLGIKAFCENFEIYSEKDKELVWNNLKIILRDMIFRKFIVLANRD